VRADAQLLCSWVPANIDRMKLNLHSRGLQAKLPSLIVVILPDWPAGFC